MKIKCRPCCVDKFKKFMNGMKSRYKDETRAYNEVENLILNHSMEVVVEYFNDRKAFRSAMTFPFVSPDAVLHFWISGDCVSYMYEVKDE